MTDKALPSIPVEPQFYGRNRDPMLRYFSDDALADALRARGWVAYKKRPHFRGNRVRLDNGTVLEQTTLDEAAT